jgi:predicted nucleic acid-binding protein
VTCFVDANVVVYSWVPCDFREACVELLAAVAIGKLDGKLSTAALEEVWQLELSGRAGDLAGLTGHAYSIFTPLLPVTDEAFRLAFALEAPEALGANDRLHAGTCQAHGIDVVVSADRGFDAVPGIRRIDLRERDAIARLLA